ncbi:hypothetical protein Cgig2_013684 [Carnegiea gigantea]|uniref:Uncharacterized protein n=1 Tax=Carnegiea gigantea TaxID=171969 RepID=A0A9Q1QGS9_9CARY|nr:hypothetical protein Cgig2_013684 [Carnegiea gigantea]
MKRIAKMSYVRLEVTLLLKPPPINAVALPSRPPSTPSLSSASPSGACTWPTDSSDLCRSICRSPIYPFSRALELWRLQIRFSNTEMDGIDLTTFNARGEGLANEMTWLAKGRKKGKKERSRGRHNLTLAMATSSSVSSGGSEEPEGAKSHDLARHSTKVDLAGRSRDGN